ncbi:hypothetical protein [Pseudonocardia sp. 73-21]|uniref:hypothetical protein n=1 Tax=Pseudonocardia sp. 73-21 TaxID=1895809 RepID=UPI00262BD7FA|nr:hypothetical protein [Pseudonocardia sp. 73-21]
MHPPDLREQCVFHARPSRIGTGASEQPEHAMPRRAQDLVELTGEKPRIVRMLLLEHLPDLGEDHREPIHDSIDQTVEMYGVQDIPAFVPAR